MTGPLAKDFGRPPRVARPPSSQSQNTYYGSLYVRRLNFEDWLTYENNVRFALGVRKLTKKEGRFLWGG
jgi:hypothetical protein